jgi:hypothetical protein
MAILRDLVPQMNAASLLASARDVSYTPVIQEDPDMVLSVRLDAKAAVLVEHMARQRGATKSDVVREALAVLAERERNPDSRTRPFSNIAPLIGCYDSGGKRLSEKTGVKFAAILQEKRRARRAR